MAVGLMAFQPGAERVGVMQKRLRSPYVGLVAGLLGFVLSGVTYLRGSR